jgi:hypothetical protein
MAISCSAFSCFFVSYVFLDFKEKACGQVGGGKRPTWKTGAANLGKSRIQLGQEKHPSWRIVSFKLESGHLLLVFYDPSIRKVISMMRSGAHIPYRRQIA